MIDKLVKLNKKKILIIGDAMLDYYVNVNANKISSEYPGVIFCEENSYYSLGGAANVACNISKYNVKVDLLSVIGNDEYKNIFLKLLSEHNINNKYIIIDENYQTIIKTRLYSQDNKQIIRFDREKNVINDHDKIVILVNEILNNKYDLIIISDYRKGLINNKLIELITEYGIKNKIKVLCDPKDNAVIYKNMWLLKPNKLEMNSLLNDYDFSEDSIIKYKNNNNITNLLITIGKQGMIFIDSNNNFIEIKSEALNVYDVTGAGDIVMAFIAIGLLCEKSLIWSIKLSNLAAKIKVSKFGAQIISILDLYKEMFEEKLINIEELEILCELIHKEEKKIVFTNGCFDIIHSGHIHILTESKKMGDILIVGLNSDESIKKLKGNDRPINKLEDRIKVLSSIENIDYIIVFNEETPLNIIKKIKPDIIVKGSDYMNKYVIGSNEVVKNGGKLIFVDLIKDKSTTSIVKKLEESL